MRVKMADSNSRRIIGSMSPTDIGRTKCGSRAATARRIPSAIRRSGIERNALDNGLALAGCHCERSVSRAQSRNGLAARGFRRADGKKSARPVARPLAAVGRPSAGDAADALAVHAPPGADRMAAPDPDDGGASRHELRTDSAGLAPPPPGAGQNTADATGALVIRDRDRARRRLDAGADLSRSLPHG